MDKSKYILLFHNEITGYFELMSRDYNIDISPLPIYLPTIEITESLYFEIHNKRAFEIKLKSISCENEDIDYYFGAFTDVDFKADFLSIDLYCKRLDLKNLWSFRNSWLNEKIDESSMEIILRDNMTI